jgi:Family of unknown function (DUF5767)
MATDNRAAAESHENDDVAPVVVDDLPERPSGAFASNTAARGATGASTPTAAAEEDPPPTLEELRAREAGASSGGSSSRPVTTDDDEARRVRRQDAYYHYQVLKRMHPNVDIPEFTIWSDPDVMEPQYDMMFKKLSLDASIDSWKRYMIGALMIFEIGLGKLNFDMEGFAHQQIIAMPTYDALIVELAEKSYVPKGSRWPVELRLLAMVFANSALFIGTKIIAKRTGTNLLGTINRMTNPTYDERVMRGPNAANAAGVTSASSSATHGGGGAASSSGGGVSFGYAPATPRDSSSNGGGGGRSAPDARFVADSVGATTTRDRGSPARARSDRPDGRRDVVDRDPLRREWQ